MTKTIPHYLRIHQAADSRSNTQPTIDSDSIDRFWNAYSEVTGWRVDPREPRQGSSLQLLPAVNHETFERHDAEMPRHEGSASAVGKSAAAVLAESAAKLAEELQSNRQAIRRQEAELASRAPILTEVDQQSQLADRIENTLAEVAMATGCQSAAMYLLDNETKYLKARSVFGLPAARLELPPRPLRGSRGDLEALVQRVVVIENAKDSIEQWNSPEECRSAICASINSDDVPIGTMWLFSNEMKPFGSAETAAARLAASHLSLELSWASLRDVDTQRSAAGPILDIANWQYESLPMGTRLAESWRVDGMIESPADWATGWHTWDILPDGTLMVAMAEASDPTARGAMAATVARAALIAHAGYRHSPKQLMQRVNDTLWQAADCEQPVSLLYGRIDPETGEGEVASSGSIQALIGSRFGYRPATAGGTAPLGSRLDPEFEQNHLRIAKGETLLAYGDGFVDSGATQVTIGENLRDSMAEQELNPLARIRRSLAGKTLEKERGALTLLRQN